MPESCEKVLTRQRAVLARARPGALAPLRARERVLARGRPHTPAPEPR